MLTYILRRLGLAALITVLAVTLLFLIIHMIPGDPVSTMLGPKASPELRAALEARMGLDKPLPVQIGLFFANMLRGDLGMDVFTNRPVTTIVVGSGTVTVTPSGGVCSGRLAKPTISSTAFPFCTAW